jgi:hypothetical protein
MKLLCPWKPHVKRNLVEDRHQLKQPQLSGTPGWLLLTHEEGTPVAFFVDGNEKVEAVPLVMDERMFSDTVLRVVRISPRVLVVYDVRWFNGRNWFTTRSYDERFTLVKDMLNFFHHPDLTALCVPDEAPAGSIVRGYEYYDDQPGTLGVFLPANE